MPMAPARTTNDLYNTSMGYGLKQIRAARNRAYDAQRTGGGQQRSIDAESQLHGRK